MEPLILTALFWMLFVGLHVGLATRNVRAAFVARFGEAGFTALFSVTASVFFALAVAWYAAHRFEGGPGLALGAVSAVRWALVAVAVAGIVLMTGGSVGYPGSPYDMIDRKARPPRGMERITRHPFFAGMALFASAHALLATRLTGTVMFASIAALSIAGPLHQDRKLLARLGERYARYLQATSAVPFAAILAGRQRIAWRELPVGALAAGLPIAIALRAMHDHLFDRGGTFVIVGTIGTAGLFALASLWTARRSSSGSATPPADLEVRAVRRAR